MKARVALALCCLSSLAFAKQAAGPIVPRLSTYNVRLEPLVVLPSGADAVGQDRVLSEDDAILETGLGYPSVAVLTSPIDVVIAGEHIVLAAGQGAMEAEAGGGALAGLRNARVFCAPPHRPFEPPRDIQFSRDFGARFPNRMAQACFVDRDRDSQLDFAFLSGTNWPDDREPVQLDRIAYATRTDVRLPNSRLRVAFVDGSLIQGMLLELQVTVFGERLLLESVKLMSENGQPAWFRTQRGVGGDYPRSISYGHARLDLLDYNRDSHRLRVRIGAPFERSDMRVRAIANVRYVYLAS